MLTSLIRWNLFRFQKQDAMFENREIGFDQKETFSTGRAKIKDKLNVYNNNH